MRSLLLATILAAVVANPLFARSRSVIKRNIVTNFGATCNGTKSDHAAFVAFNTWAVAWQAKNDDLINLIIPQNGKSATITNLQFGSGARATATVVSGSISAIALTAGGSGYNASTVVVAISGGGGSGGAATATISGGAVTSIAVHSGGSGYTSAPTVTISSPIVLTTATPMGWKTGQYVTVSGVVGTTSANNTFGITVVDSTDFVLNNSGGNSAYTSGGEVNSNVCMFPEGNSGNFHPFANGIKNLLVSGQGVTLSDAGTGGFTLGGAGTSTVGPVGTHSARVATVPAGNLSVTLLTPAQSKIFTVSSYALMAGIDLQGYGYPQNPAIFEYVYITNIDSASGVITFSAPLKHSYESTWPVYDSGAQFQNDEGGPATLFTLDPSWNIQVEYDGLTISQSGQTYADGLSITYRGVTFSGGNCGIPTQNETWTLIDVNMEDCDMEVDKIIDTVVMNGVTIRSIYFQSASVYNFTLENSNVTDTVNGSPINFTCINSAMASFSPGAYAYGVSNSTSLNNCAIPTFGSDGFSTGIVPGKATMANGIITVPNSSGPSTWAVPGAALYWGGQYQNEGAPTTVVDLTQDSNNTYIQTSLSGGLPNLPYYQGVDLVVRTHPAVRFSCIACTGSATALDLSQAPAGTPLWAFTQRSYTLSAKGNYPGATIWGNLVSLTINVIKPYTGKQSTLSLNALGEFQFPVIQANGTVLLYDPIVNLKLAGSRTINQMGVSGQQSGDSGLALGGAVWLTQAYTGYLSTDISSEDPSVWPIVQIAIVTSQN
jgi:hypothetical protein